MLARWIAVPAPLKGTLLMLAAMALFAIMLVQVRMVGQAVPVVIVIIVRQLITQLAVCIHAGRDAPRLLQTRNLRMQLWRAFFTLGTTIATYVTFVYLPFALATAISFSAVLFVTIGAAVFLKEKVDIATWGVTLFGLFGVYIMLGPTESGSLPFVVLAILGAVCAAGTILTVRAVGTQESLGTVLTYQGLLVVPVLIVPTILYWQTPTLEQWLLLISIGVVGTAAQFTFVSAYRYAEASRLAPLDFVRLVLMTLAGLLFFNEQLHPPLMAGMLIIVGTTIYTIRSNARRQAEVLPVPSVLGDAR